MTTCSTTSEVHLKKDIQGYEEKDIQGSEEKDIQDFEETIIIS